MDMQGALRARLIAAVPAVAGRVYWGERPQGTPLPDILLQVVSAPREYEMRGAQVVQWVRVQADTRAATFGAALTAANAIVAEMEDAATFQGIKFLAAVVEGPVDRGEQTATAFIHRQQTDLLFYYSPA